jgi:biopolymer transport protein ExbB
MKRSIKRILEVLALCSTLMAVFAPAQAYAWWNSDWSERKKITLDTSANGAAINDAIGAMPVLIRLHSGNFKFDKAKNDGGDIRFVAGDDNTPLKFHIEKFNNLLGEAFVWVNVPDIKPGTQTELYLYYGNPKANAADDPKGTYDSAQTLVYHFEEQGTAARDATVWGNNAQTAGLASDGSLIGGGLRLDGQHMVQLPASQSLRWDAGQAVTWSGWVRNGAPQAGTVIFSRHDGANGFVVGIDSGAPFVEIDDAQGAHRSSMGTAIAANSWHHFAVVVSGQQTQLYLDGAVYGSVAAGLPALAGPSELGGDSAPAGGVQHVNFVGEMDELQIAKTARSPGFLKAEALGQGGDNAKLVTFGADEEQASWLSGYFAVILKSVTLDGWVVIGILSVMAVISWVVMAEKASYIGKVAKANAIFLGAFNRLTDDLTELDRNDAAALHDLADVAERERMNASSLFRIYHIGSREISLRATRFKDFAHTGLAPQSIEAIRAALDAGMARETQKLNRQMVLLTIAIAGGPFLGLLGTVIGVMITFAAIAASGDVNVNSIAPGIAAALVATVAGLIVAIPALFGYNYLNTRIRDIGSDMQVFVDEFITKMAEFYRPRGPYRTAAE